jgi:glycosyltransferase involved in cell wall biosynthesis
MPVILSPEVPPQAGGIATYIEVITRAMPEVLIRALPSLSYPSLSLNFWGLRGQEVWVQHVLPVGTVAYIFKWAKLIPAYRVFFHGMDWDLSQRTVWKKWLTTRILQSSAEVIVNSRALRKDILEVYPTLKVKVVHPTLTPEMLEAGLANTPKLQDRRGLVRVLAVARLVERKGLQVLLRSVAAVPNLHLTLVGEGPFRPQLEALAQTLGIQGRVDFRGALQDNKLIEAYREADIFALTPVLTAGTREGFGIVYLEAAAFGLPIIAADQAGIKDAVRAGENALLVAPEVEDLAAALGALAADAPRRLQMGLVGQAWVREYGQLHRVRAEFLQTQV